MGVTSHIQKGLELVRAFLWLRLHFMYTLVDSAIGVCEVTFDDHCSSENSDDLSYTVGVYF